MTQRERVLALLQTAGPDGVCLAEVPGDLSYVLRNRVGDIAKLGYVITSQRCRVHQHRGQIARYRLEGKITRGTGAAAAVATVRKEAPVSPNLTPSGVPSRVGPHHSPASTGAAAGSLPVPAVAPTVLDLFPPTSPLRQGHGV